MTSSNASSTAQWGKLTSMNPDFENICLSKNPSDLILLSEDLNEKDLSSEEKCQIYQENGEFFIQYKGHGLSVLVQDQIIKESEAFKMNSGEKISLVMKKEGRIRIKREYIFSSELKDSEKDNLKRDREKDEEIEIFEKKMKFDENLKDEAKCMLCCKMIYECVSVVPCLHSFCLYCFMLHLKSSQECPQCEERFKEFRKDVFLNNIIEAYDESWERKDRSIEECKERKERLETEKVFARFEYTNGEIYEGEWKKCQKYGRGKILLKNGNVYEGEWRNSKREGEGKMNFADGGVYNGDWKNGLFHGKGKMSYKSGNIYEGYWKEGEKEGYGRMQFASGNVYEGDWKNDNLEGKGKYTFPDGEIYEGDYKNNRRNGKGKMIYNSGAVYEGDWKDGHFHGEGKLIYSTGAVYEGEWKDGLRDGKGKTIFKSGNIYEGDWKKDDMEGHGKAIYADGDVYEGSWKSGKRAGQGKMIYQNGTIYEGNWENDERKGFGKLVRVDGSIYEGDWKNSILDTQR